MAQYRNMEPQVKDIGRSSFGVYSISSASRAFDQINAMQGNVSTLTKPETKKDDKKK